MDKSKKLIIVIILLVVIIGGVSFYAFHQAKENKEKMCIRDSVCVPFKVVTCASMFQTYWRPWDESMHAHWVRPVSYTHLDVYKRQTQCAIL